MLACLWRMERMEISPAVLRHETKQRYTDGMKVWPFKESRRLRGRAWYITVQFTFWNAQSKLQTIFVAYQYMPRPGARARLGLVDQ